MSSETTKPATNQSRHEDTLEALEALKTSVDIQSRAMVEIYYAALFWASVAYILPIVFWGFPYFINIAHGTLVPYL